MSKFISTIQFTSWSFSEMLNSCDWCVWKFFSWESIQGFLWGASLVGLCWTWYALRSLLPDEIDADEASWIEPWNVLREMIVESSRNTVRHIGELPSRRQKRTPWPWETTKRRRRRQSISTTTTTTTATTTEGVPSSPFNNQAESSANHSSQHGQTQQQPISLSTETSFQSADESSKAGSEPEMENDATTGDDTDDEFKDIEVPNAREKQICIGSIFGLDVGGTLAKLVYFKKNPMDIVPQPPTALVNTLLDLQYEFSSPSSSVKGRHGTNNDNNNRNHHHHHHHHHAKSASTSSPSASKAQSTAAAKKKNATTSTFRITGETMSRFDATARPSRSRSRSLSLGCMARFKDLQFAAEDQETLRSTSLTNTTSNTEIRTTTTATSSTATQKTPAQRKSSYGPMLSMGTAMDLMENSRPLPKEFSRDEETYSTNHRPKSNNNNNNSNSKVQFQNNDHLESGTNDDDHQKHQHQHHSSSFGGTGHSVSPPPSPHPSTPTTQQQQQQQHRTNRMKNSRSMMDLLQSEKKAAALDKFYNLARSFDDDNAVADTKLGFYSRELGGEFHFLRFESRKVRESMDLIRFHNLHLNISKVGATGGGAHKYAEEFDRILGIQMDKQDELDSLVAGMQFVLSTVVGECYTFRPKAQCLEPTPSSSTSSSSTTTSSNPPSASASFSSKDGDNVNADKKSDIAKQSNENDATHAETPTSRTSPSKPPNEPEQSTPAASSIPANKMIDEWWWSRKVQRDAVSYSSTYPYMLVTIGTGVSILRVDGPRKHERISGSTIGGGTYWGLMRLLTDVEDFDDVLTLAEKGDPAKVDMMVGDIYGDNNDALAKLGLPSNIVASSFGKLVAKDDPAAGLEQEDLARALLLMITNNIGQVAYLNAKLHNTRRIFFVGNFLRSNVISQRRLSFAIDYWSKGEMEALFLEHEGYFGALGAFLMSQNISQDDGGFFQWDMWRDTQSAPGIDDDTDGKQSNMHRRRQTFST